MIVVDTNVVSELMKPSPSGVVREWVLGQRPRELFTTSITVADILYGIELLAEGQRKDMLRTAATDIFTAFEDHVIPFDHDATLATRNVKDFEHTGITLVDPWKPT